MRFNGPCPRVYGQVGAAPGFVPGGAPARILPGSFATPRHRERTLQQRAPDPGLAVPASSPSAAPHLPPVGDPRPVFVPRLPGRVRGVAPPPCWVGLRHGFLRGAQRGWLLLLGVSRRFHPRLLGDEPAPTPGPVESYFLPADEHPAPPYDGLLERGELHGCWLEWQCRPGEKVVPLQGGRLTQSLTPLIVMERAALGTGLPWEVSMARAGPPGCTGGDPEEGVRRCGGAGAGADGWRGLPEALLEILSQPRGEASRGGPVRPSWKRVGEGRGCCGHAGRLGGASRLNPPRTWE